MTKKIKNNTKDFIWNAIGLTLNACNSLFFLIVVRYFNGLDTAGIFTYAFALCSLFFVIALYFNRSFQVSDSKNRFHFNDYLTCRIITSLSSFVLIFIFAIINQFSAFEIAVTMFLMLFRIIETISDCFYGAIHKKSKLYQTGISLSLKAIFGLAAFAITDFFTQNLILALIALILVNLLFFIFYDFRNFKTLYSEKIRFKLTHLKSILKICFPVFLFSILSLYLSNCQKYVLPYFESNEIQTIFGILIMPATVLGLAGSYLVNPSIEPLTQHFEKHDFLSFIKLSKKILSSILGIGLIAIIACYFIGIPILNFIYSLDLSEYLIPLLLIITASIFFAITLLISSLLTILKENRRQTYIYIFVSIITTIISVFLIQSLGIVGAVYAFLISSILLVFPYLILLQLKIHRLRSTHEK